MEQARLKAEASKIETESELSRLAGARQAELKYVGEKNELEIGKEKQVADIDVHKFQQMVQAIGQGTLQAIATAGPDNQVGI